MRSTTLRFTRSSLLLYLDTLNAQNMPVAKSAIAQFRYFVSHLPLAGRKLWRQRLFSCAHCPISSGWRRKHRSGVIGSSWPAWICRPYPSSPLGCACSMPLKALLAKSDCWARENGHIIGWPDELRPLTGTVYDTK